MRLVGFVYIIRNEARYIQCQNSSCVSSAMVLKQKTTDCLVAVMLFYNPPPQITLQKMKIFPKSIGINIHDFKTLQ